MVGSDEVLLPTGTLWSRDRPPAGTSRVLGGILPLPLFPGILHPTTGGFPDGITLTADFRTQVTFFMFGVPLLRSPGMPGLTVRGRGPHRTLCTCRTVPVIRGGAWLGLLGEQLTRPADGPPTGTLSSAPEAAPGIRMHSATPCRFLLHGLPTELRDGGTGITLDLLAAGTGADTARPRRRGYIPVLGVGDLPPGLNMGAFGDDLQLAYPGEAQSRDQDAADGGRREDWEMLRQRVDRSGYPCRGKRVTSLRSGGAGYRPGCDGGGNAEHQRDTGGGQPEAAWHDEQGAPEGCSCEEPEVDAADLLLVDTDDRTHNQREDHDDGAAPRRNSGAPD